eukprot:m.84050 g.84050  ORF g.84050 m.84050 type:complete len:66 (-) comp8705_c0_seq5:2743-2940(-)
MLVPTMRVQFDFLLEAFGVIHCLALLSFENDVEIKKCEVKCMDEKKERNRNIKKKWFVTLTSPIA